VTPRRLWRRRTPGYRLADQVPAGERIVCVTHGTKWGNPFDWQELGRDEAKRLYAERFPTFGLDAGEIAGAHLACYCPPGEACHADVLLEMAAEVTARQAVFPAWADREAQRILDRAAMRLLAERLETQPLDATARVDGDRGECGLDESAPLIEG
jgi:hypothetical protein